MSRRSAPMLVLVPVVLLSLGATFTPAKMPPPLTVHEWGTFTSIAGPDGRAAEWSPLDGPQELPCFVERYATTNIKGAQPGTLRMETPVLYFYAPDDVTVDVNVRFQGGAITEWYPHATVTPKAVSFGDIERAGFASSLSWTGVHVTPRAATPALPRETRHSHYYLARETDAAPVQVGAQQEKFLFYRGLAASQPPLTARVADDGTITVKSPRGTALGDLILFENRGGRMAYQVQQIGESAVTLSPPPLGSASTPPTLELEQILIAHGLFPREAKAMVDTWRDSWFDEGSRLFYIAPRATVDQMLPLQITPAPTEIERAFVGRMELVTSRTLEDVRTAIERNDGAALLKYVRYIRPIAAQMGPRMMVKIWDVLAPAVKAQELARKPCPQSPVLVDQTTQKH